MLRRLTLFLICCSLAGFAQAKRPFTFEDMMQLKRIGEPSVSPDGKWVTFSAVDVNLEANTKTPHLWIVPINGGESRRLTPETDREKTAFGSRPMVSACCSKSAKEGSVADLRAGLRHFDGNADWRSSQGDEHFHRSFRLDMVADGKSILFVSSV